MSISPMEIRRGTDPRPERRKSFNVYARSQTPGSETGILTFRSDRPDR